MFSIKFDFGYGSGEITPLPLSPLPSLANTLKKRLNKLVGKRERKTLEKKKKPKIINRFWHFNWQSPMSELIFQLREREREGDSGCEKALDTRLGQSTSPSVPSSYFPPATVLAVAQRGDQRVESSRVSSLESSLEASRQIQNVINFVHIRNHFSITKTYPLPPSDGGYLLASLLTACYDFWQLIKSNDRKSKVISIKRSTSRRVKLLRESKKKKKYKNEISERRRKRKYTHTHSHTHVNLMNECVRNCGIGEGNCDSIDSTR